ncbi:AAA family ATPase [Phytobacter diazotrophicus]|uniref:AAA family ATPase n=1 Tax=Phytobacter diazotrophicus TaxID=395631 RepID=UPI00232D59D7|nr:AAA family ATPase [Phytobacter diazotrophicus]MDC0726920.1 AAA family ATPase [Phytobacter diazotrophicus]MDC0734385.1 AAA family ATPase [Phytobacter diazotrophicus]
MRIDKIQLRNFRCFEQLDVTFHPQMTVLIAPNGAGKTTILDAVRIALWPFVKGFDLGSQTGKSATIQIDDVRLLRNQQNMEPVLPSEIIATGSNIGPKNKLEWLQRREQVKPRTQTKGNARTGDLMRWASKIQSDIYSNQENKPVDNLPLIVYLGTGRLWYQGRYTSEAEDKKLDNSVFSRLWGYQNCLTATSSYKQFETWYGWVFRSYRELQITQLENKSQAENNELTSFAAAITVVQTAINQLTEKLTGWHDLQYRSSMGQQLVMEHPEQGFIPLEMLSDGLRNMVAMVSDIAFRCVKLNPHLGERAAFETRGVVLIDEVDMFLHPAWQQTVLGALQTAFPKLQFIVTTHSPQVISTVSSESVRVLGENVEGVTIAGKPLTNTYGEPSNKVLQTVMQVDPQPPIKEKEHLQRLTELVDQGQSDKDEARKLMKELIKSLGDQHPQLQRLQRSIERQQRLAEWKQKK